MSKYSYAFCNVNFDDDYAYNCFKFRICNQNLCVDYKVLNNAKQRTYTDNYGFSSILLIEVLTGQMYLLVCNVVMSGHLKEVLLMKI